MKKKKSTIFKVLLTIIIIVVILAIIAGVYLFSKIHSLSDSITNPLDRDKSELRDKPAKEGDPMTVVLYGIDDDAQREQQGMGQRSDSIVLMSVNPKDKKTVMVSVPRDTRAKIVGKGTTEKINHAYAYGGPKMAVNSLEKLMDVPVDHYISIDMDGVKTVVDELGGVNVTSNASFTTKTTNGTYSFKHGQSYKMDGKKALAYMRSRKEDGAGGDEGRQLRQQQVITAVAREAFSVNSVTKLNGIFKAAQDNLKTDLSFVQLNRFKSDYDKAQDNVERLTINGQNALGDDNLYYFYPDKNSLNDVKEKLKENLNLN
ncbi:LCP family glycopolymer transferase [Staphylococcus haemolyticus]|uniref:LCP family glycopolymer transferase n=1 Tax=Staphylococcus haemolyticus TaxID=1283 RepID=UPI000D1DF5CE|nr:LCP family protein [Staphylococcus haemolyticus]MBU6947460.1 LCP family protein [Staphylococcus haemolyticus]MBU7212385.1 LCP family protein [Staphylococcus haemolyticus]MCE5022099.1 LCP family protein [Staphylococcus haemolyticus]PTK51146.1 LytR family transcriptional regulator [Staphylococcus haemolyticus]PTK57091.1 LytR family transcriptional regulator [Staphylococcus haemolyticus]